MVQIRKKTGLVQLFEANKIIEAVKKSADRVNIEMTSVKNKKLIDIILEKIKDKEVVDVAELHKFVELALDEVDQGVAKSYREYRNYKLQFVKMLDEVYRKKLSLNNTQDASNANADSALVTTQKAITYNELNSELYRRFFLTDEEEKAMVDGYIYIHDRGSRLDASNCFRRDTRFITNEGVKSFYDFMDGDVVTVVSHKGIWRKARVVKLPWCKLQRVWFKRGSGKETYIDCTPNHRWILKDGTITTDLKVGDSLYPTIDRTIIDLDSLSYEELKLWCLGFGFADGCVSGVNKRESDKLHIYMRIRLCGSKVSYASLFLKAGYTVSNTKNSSDLFVYISTVHCKTLPYNMNERKISIFMNGFMSADGNKQLDNGKHSLYRGVQVTGDFNNWIYDFLNIAGYYVTRVTSLCGEETNYGTRGSRTFSYDTFSNSGDRSWKVVRIEDTKLNPKANVWCLDVEEDHSFMLEKGIPTGNCCLFDMKSVLTGGFEMGNMHYNEPKTIGVAFSVMLDVIFNAGSSQYGGFTVSEVDKLLAPYAEKSYNLYVKEYEDIKGKVDPTGSNIYATNKLRREIEQHVQAMEMKLNSCETSRGDYIFTSISFGLSEDRFGQMISSAILKVRKEGQGKDGFKRPVLFPKLTFMYDENLHGDGKELEWLFLEAVDCTMKAQYPDFLSMTGDGYAPSIYKKYGVTISRMGCRANLSPWYEKGGIEPADDKDVPVYEGRFNMGAISLNFPMIVAKAKEENKDFFKVLEYYLDLCRKIHLRTLEYFSHKKAGINPLAFCQGGFYKGYKDPDEELGKDFLKPCTVSFGITALNEATVMYNGKTIYEDKSEFASQVLQFINDYANKHKKEDGVLYAIYGTPAESLASLQVKQFRKKYGVIKGVSDKEYMSNSFHMHVSEDITPIEKQDAEYKCFHLCNGGNIMYNRFTSEYNKESFVSLIRRAMKLGYYYGCNQSKDYCKDCGKEFIDLDKCPSCGSENIVRIERVCGYLSYSRVGDRTRVNEGKLAEIADRKSM